MKARTTVWLIAATVSVSACGKNYGSPTSSTPPTTTTVPPSANSGPPTVSITANGFAPSEVTVTVGTTVTFKNNDSRPHDMLGGPDHTRLDCPQVDVVGFLVPGQSRETAMFPEARVCEFHDHNNVGNPAFQGRIIIR